MHCPGGNAATATVDDELVAPGEVDEIYQYPELPDDDGDLDLD